VLALVSVLVLRFVQTLWSERSYSPSQARIPRFRVQAFGLLTVLVLLVMLLVMLLMLVVMLVLMVACRWWRPLPLPSD
jgi:hypothetical protein